MVKVVNGRSYAFPSDIDGKVQTKCRVSKEHFLMVCSTVAVFCILAGTVVGEEYTSPYDDLGDEMYPEPDSIPNAIPYCQSADEFLAEYREMMGDDTITFADIPFPWESMSSVHGCIPVDDDTGEEEGAVLETPTNSTVNGTVTQDNSTEDDVPEAVENPVPVDMDMEDGTSISFLGTSEIGSDGETAWVNISIDLDSLDIQGGFISMDDLSFLEGMRVTADVSIDVLEVIPILPRADDAGDGNDISIPPVDDASVTVNASGDGVDVEIEGNEGGSNSEDQDSQGEDDASEEETGDDQVEDSVPAQRILVVAQDGSGDFTDITSAVNAASSGDIIRVLSGTYNERFTVPASMTIEGEDARSTIIQGTGVVTGIIINASDVTLRNMTVRDFSYGIWAVDVDGLTLDSMTLTRNTNGLRVSLGAESTRVERSIITGNDYGISILHSSNFTIRNSSLTGNSIRDLYMVESVTGVNAAFNWWGTPGGPEEGDVHCILSRVTLLPALDEDPNARPVPGIISFNDSTGRPIDGGLLYYYEGGWHGLGSFSNGTIMADIMPGHYSFKVIHRGKAFQMDDVKVLPGHFLYFETVVATVLVQDTEGNPMDGGIVTFHASGWQPVGTTVNGTATTELLPGVYSIKLVIAERTLEMYRCTFPGEPVVFTLQAPQDGTDEETEDSPPGDDQVEPEEPPQDDEGDEAQDDQDEADDKVAPPVKDRSLTIQWYQGTELTVDLGDTLDAMVIAPERMVVSGLQEGVVITGSLLTVGPSIDIHGQDVVIERNSGLGGGTLTISIVTHQGPTVVNDISLPLSSSETLSVRYTVPLSLYSVRRDDVRLFSLDDQEQVRLIDVSVADAGHSLWISPREDLVSLGNYEVTILDGAFTDTDQVKVPGISFRFTIGDEVPPTIDWMTDDDVLRAFPIDGVFQLALSENVSHETLTLDIERDHGQDWSLSIDGNMLTVGAATPLPFGDTYSLTIDGIQDLSGNPLGSALQLDIHVMDRPTCTIIGPENRIGHGMVDLNTLCEGTPDHLGALEYTYLYRASNGSLTHVDGTGDRSDPTRSLDTSVHGGSTVTYIVEVSHNGSVISTASHSVHIGDGGILHSLPAPSALPSLMVIGAALFIARKRRGDTLHN